MTKSAFCSALCVLLPLLSWGCSKDDDTPGRTTADAGAAGADAATGGDAANGGSEQATGGASGSSASAGTGGGAGAPATAGGTGGDAGGSATTGGALAGGAAGNPPTTGGTLAGGAAGSATTGGTGASGGEAGAAAGGGNAAGAGGAGGASATAGAAGSLEGGNGGSAGSVPALDCTWTILEPVSTEYGTGWVDDDGVKTTGNINVYTRSGRGFLKFDLSSLDANADVMAVTLTLTLESTDADTQEPGPGSRVYPLTLDPTTADGATLYEDCEAGDSLWSGEWDFGGAYSSVAVDHELNETGVGFVQDRISEGWAGFGIAHQGWWYEFYGNQSTSHQPQLGVCVAN